MQVDRDVVPDRAVGSDLVVVSAPILQLFAGIGKVHDPMGVKHSARSLLLNVSKKPLSVDLPGREKSSVTLVA